MIFKSKIWIVDQKGQEKFFGRGPYDILCNIDRYGSLNKAAKVMNMSYSKAFKVMKRSEEILGVPLIESEIGGASGGGSRLTKQAYELMEIYRRAEKKVQQALDELNAAYENFGEQNA